MIRTLRIGHRRPWQPPAIRNAFCRRPYNASGQQQQQQQQAPHTTYFQLSPQEPRSRRRHFRTILWSTTCFTLGALGYHFLFSGPLSMLEELAMEAEDVMSGAIAVAALDAIAKEVPPITLEEADELLGAQSGFSVTPKAVGHTCQSPANMPCEDSWSTGAFNLFNDSNKDWAEWAIFDGHAGPRTAHFLKHLLPSAVGQALWDASCMDKPYRPNDWNVISTIKKAFLDLDKDILDAAAEKIGSGGALADVIATGAVAFSGSCALLALFDPAHSVLRVANVGDSRAVLGRWDPVAAKYVAKPMSVDQTGFNQDEVARLKSEHPGEDDIVDPRSGRVHGIAISRAFGDARWKWANPLSKMAREKFWGPNPRPDSMIKTPPYLTAEPEVMEIKVQTSGHPDFLIMASDGLWDQMSSQDAVTCVQLWLDRNKPEAFITEPESISPKDLTSKITARRTPKFTSAADLADDDTYYDEAEKCMQWRVKPKHFVVEDDNCGVHLVKNALGGKRRDLFTGIMSVQPPLARNVRDDITVHVVFFGVETEPLMKKR